MTIPGTVEKTTSAMGRSNSNSNAKSPTKAVQIKSITMKIGEIILISF